MSHFKVAVFSKTGTIEELKELLAPYEETFDKDNPLTEFIEDEDCDEVNPETGKNGYWANPKAKWDYWTIGGGWRGELKLIKGATSGGYARDIDPLQAGTSFELGKFDFARVIDCDFTIDKAHYKNALRFWDIYVERKPCSREEYTRVVMRSPFEYTPEYYKEQFANREKYAVEQAEFSVYAMLTEEGNWCQTGQMGWWGMDDATQESRSAFKKFFRNYIHEALEKDLWITIVDCHI